MSWRSTAVSYETYLPKYILAKLWHIHIQAEGKLISINFNWKTHALSAFACVNRVTLKRKLWTPFLGNRGAWVLFKSQARPTILCLCAHMQFVRIFKFLSNYYYCKQVLKTSWDRYFWLCICIRLIKNIFTCLGLHFCLFFFGDFKRVRAVL